VREDFLHQNAFEPVDTYSSLPKQFRLLDVILSYYRLAEKALDKGTPLETLLALPVKERIARAKLIPEDDMAEFDKLLGDLQTQVAQAGSRGKTQ
jgi:V/A-type H+-transporting ATPase subunit A